MVFLRFAVLAVGAGLTVAACGTREGETPLGSDGTTTPPARADKANDVATDLPSLAGALIPREALDRDEEELVVEECGIAPVFPCVRAYFVIEDLDLRQRVRLIRRNARAAGWSLRSERRDPSVTLEFEREPFRATYMVEQDDPLLCEAAARCLAGAMLTVVAPPTPLPAPTDAERALWSDEKKTFVHTANAVCKDMLTRAAERPSAFSEALASGLEELAALAPPASDATTVEHLLRPLRTLVKAARALSDGRGEDALPAAVAVAEFAKRFNRAAARYGLDQCAMVG
jgi:hypothetical protein